MKIYTKTGDQGETGLFGGARVPKDDPRVEAYGAVDELNSVLGMARAEGVGDLDEDLGRIQSELFDIGGELATDPEKRDRVQVPRVTEAAIEQLEGAIDRAEVELSPLTTFILPGGTRAAAALHLARTVCRRAERRIVSLGIGPAVRPEVLRYLNRLSDLLFTWARLSNHRASVPDTPWVGRDRA